MLTRYSSVNLTAEVITNYISLITKATSCCFSRDSSIVAVGLKNGSTVIVDVLSLKKIKSITTHQQEVKYLNFVF